MESLSDKQRNFLIAYYKACETSQPEDWREAAMLGKRMFNEMADLNFDMHIADGELLKKAVGAYK